MHPYVCLQSVFRACSIKWMAFIFAAQKIYDLPDIWVMECQSVLVQSSLIHVMLIDHHTECIDLSELLLSHCSKCVPHNRKESKLVAPATTSSWDCLWHKSTFCACWLSSFWCIFPWLLSALFKLLMEMLSFYQSFKMRANMPQNFSLTLWSHCS